MGRIKILFLVLFCALSVRLYGADEVKYTDVNSLGLMFMNEPEHCLEVLDQIEKKGTDNPFNCERIRIYCYDALCRYPEMIASAERCMSLVDRYADDPVRATVDLSQSMTTICSHINFFDQAMRYARRGIEVAEQAGDYNVTVGYLQFSMAQLLSRMGYAEDALDKAVNGYETSCKPSCAYDESRRDAYQTSMLLFIVQLYGDAGQYDKALTYAEKSYDAVKRVGGHNELPANFCKEIECNVAFTLAYVNRKLGNKAEADKWLEQGLAMNIDSKSVRQAKIRYYAAERDYNTVKDLVLADMEFVQSRGDTLSTIYIDNWETLSQAQSALGEYDEAYRSASTALRLSEKHKQSIVQSNALELSIIYDVHDKQKTIMRQKQELRLFVVVLLLILVVVVLLVYRNREITRRNRRMVEHIRQLQTLQKERQSMLSEHSAPTSDVDSEPSTEPDSETETDADGRSAGVSMDERRLQKIYQIVVDILEKDEFYLQPLNLDEWCNKIGYNRNLVNRAMQQCRGESLTKYISELKLIHSTELLTNHSLSLETIAEACGFGSTVTFIRNFKLCYGMTPSQYRKFA